MLRHPRSLFLFLSVLLHFSPSLAYSLKNCTIKYSKDPTRVSVSCCDRGLAAVPNDVPSNTRSLDLTSNHILGINRTDFRSLSQLVILYIGSNSMSHINDGAFVDLVELKYLDIRYNNLTNLTDNMFQGLSKLVSLSLDDNQITYISRLAFQPLISLETVELSSNNLHQISDIVPILLLPNLQDLSMAFNKFPSFESGDLPLNESSLRTLMLGSNPLRKISIIRDVFPHLELISFNTCTSGFEWDVANKTFLRNVTKVFLRNTEISFETYRLIFQSLESVKFLSLTDMKQWLDEGLMDIACQIPALRDLDLSSNDIYILNNTLLQSCSKITKLTLSANLMTDLSENSLQPLNQLTQLELNINCLTRVPRAIRGLSSLVVLMLQQNDIGDLDCSDFLNLTSLLQLFLSNNRISKLRGCFFQDLKNLTLLSIEDNPIFQLYGTFKVSLHNLRTLKMKGNYLKFHGIGEFQALSSLSSLDIESVSECSGANGTFEGLDHLQTLTLSPYFLWKDMFRGLSHLDSLTVHLPTFMNTLSHQDIYGPPFLDVPYLRKLSIKNKNDFDMPIPPDLLRGLKDLEHFAAEKFFSESPHPDTFIYTPHLQSLKIISCNISNLNPRVLQPIPHLQTLDLSKNKLRSLDFLARANLTALSLLSLRDNELMAITETVFQSLPALTYLDLFGNPFSCDCSNTGFIQWVKSNNQTQVVNAYQYACSFPVAAHGMKLLDFDVQSCWTNVSFLCFVSTTCLVLLTLLSSFIYHFLRWQLVYAFYLFQAFLYDKKKKGTRHQYDAFVSYNVQDEAWVYREMLPVLEGEQGWRLCVHHRDFQPGKPIMENITDAIYGSRKTICVISRDYLQSEWCSREIQMASFRLFDEQKDVLILLFLEEIPNHQLSPYYRMRKLVKRRTYLSWPRTGHHTRVFWENVRRALETGEAPTDNNLLTPE